METLKEIKINRIIPARSWNYMYANDYFIYSHRDRVSFFAKKEPKHISHFKDIVYKLIAVKWFDEESKNIPYKLNNFDFENNKGEKIKVGVCLVSKDLRENYKAEVWIDNINEEVIFKLFQADSFENKTDSDIELPDPKENERLRVKKQKFNNCKEKYDSKFIELVYNHPNFFQRLISFAYPFTLDELNKYKNIIIWRELSLNENIEWNNKIISKFVSDLDWDNLCTNKKVQWDAKRIRKFEDYIIWSSLSKNKNIEWSKIIEIYEHKLDWEALASNQTFPWKEKNIKKYSDNIVDLSHLFINSNVEISEKVLNKFRDKIDFQYLSKNEGDFWTEELVDKFNKDLEWEYLSRNPSLPWSLSFIQNYYERFDWVNLSMNPKIPWSEYFIEKYKSKIDFVQLSGNTGLPWTLELVEKYLEEWSWIQLGSNPGIPWTEEFINKYLDKFKNRWNGTYSLWSNTNLPQNEEFWIDHKDILFPKQKGKGLMRIIDASNNDCLPVSISLLFKLKENLDWDIYLCKMIKRTGKFEELIKEFDDSLMELILETDHFYNK